MNENLKNIKIGDLSCDIVDDIACEVDRYDCDICPVHCICSILGGGDKPFYESLEEYKSVDKELYDFFIKRLDNSAYDYFKKYYKNIEVKE